VVRRPSRQFAQPPPRFANAIREQRRHRPRGEHPRVGGILAYGRRTPSVYPLRGDRDGAIYFLQRRVVLFAFRERKK
jgi:hypothetical protein